MGYSGREKALYCQKVCTKTYAIKMMPAGTRQAWKGRWEAVLLLNVYQGVVYVQPPLQPGKHGCRVYRVRGTSLHGNSGVASSGGRLPISPRKTVTSFYVTAGVERSRGVGDEKELPMPFWLLSLLIVPFGPAFFLYYNFSCSPICFFAPPSHHPGKFGGIVQQSFYNCLT